MKKREKEIILPKVFDKLKEFIGLMTADLLLLYKIQNELILVAIVLYQIVSVYSSFKCHVILHFKQFPVSYTLQGVI
jgi:hypothetical protein